MEIWLDDVDFITIVTKDGETIAEVATDGKAYFKRVEED